MRTVLLGGATAALLGSLWALSGVVGALFHPSQPPLQSPGGPPPGGTSVPPPGCTPYPVAPASAVLVPAPSPTGWRGAGTVLSVAYELRLLPISGGPSQGAVEMPSLTAVFPNSSGGSLAVFIPPRTLQVSTAAWTDPGLTSRGHTFATPVTFPANGTAWMTSQLLAVMASAPYGSVALEVRWSWNMTLTGQALEASAWTTPSSTGTQPSIFYPQTYVSLSPVGPRSATIGESLTYTLSQGPAAAHYLLKLENASTGAGVNRVSATAPSGASQSFSVSIPVLGAKAPISPGAYLVHLHSACGAILYSVPVNATFAPSASVGIVTQPASCGPVTIDGVAQASGAHWSTHPSTAGHALSAGSCTNATFAGWLTSGGAYVAGPSNATTSLTVDASGTLTAQYR